MKVTATTLVLCLAACASATATLDGASVPTCDAARAMGLTRFTGQGERFADDAAMVAAHPDDDVTAVCADDDELCRQGALWAFNEDPESSTLGLQVTDGPRRIRYAEIFPTPSLVACHWLSLPRVIWSRDWAAVRVHGKIEDSPECARQTPWTQFALVQRDSGRIAVVGRCQDAEATFEALPDGERLRVVCQGREAVLPIDDVAACSP